MFTFCARIDRISRKTACEAYRHLRVRWQSTIHYVTFLNCIEATKLKFQTSWSSLEN